VKREPRDNKLGSDTDAMDDSKRSLGLQGNSAYVD
jgi:hypothetical protein